MEHTLTPTITPTNAVAAARYSRGAIVLHWLIAVSIWTNIAIAWATEGLPKAERSAWMGTHQALGITILLLTLVRIGWRLTHRPPPMLATLKPWEAKLARFNQFAFYFVMLAIPLSGWAMASAFGKGRPVSMFGLFDFPALPVAGDKPTAELFEQLHGALAFAFLGLFVLHLAGALKHHLIDKDGTLRRMLPFLA